MYVARYLLDVSYVPRISLKVVTVTVAIVTMHQLEI